MVLGQSVPIGTGHRVGWVHVHIFTDLAVDSRDCMQHGSGAFGRLVPCTPGAAGSQRLWVCSFQVASQRSLRVPTHKLKSIVLESWSINVHSAVRNGYFHPVTKISFLLTSQIQPRCSQLAWDGSGYGWQLNLSSSGSLSSGGCPHVNEYACPRPSWRSLMCKSFRKENKKATTK